MDNEYYVYVYLDPRKKGFFSYRDYSFEYEPFYVGKGKKSRLLRHLKINEHNSLKNNKISKIISEGLNPIILKIENNLTNEESLKIESEVIKTIGKIIDKKGPLTNISDGGETFIGYKHTDKYINTLIKPVIKYDISGNKIDEYSSVKEAGEKNNVFPQTISSICNGSIKIWKDKYIFLYANENFQKRFRDKKQYPVTRTDYLGNKTTYESISEASKMNNVLLSKINQVCMGNKFQTSGYLWEYVNHPKMDEYKSVYNKNFEKYLEYMDKKIYDNKGVAYQNLLHLLSQVKNAKVNNIYNLLTSKKNYKVNDN
jgi:hypothetical protein